MSIDGEVVAERIGREHRQRFAEENDLDAERVLDHAQHVAETAPGATIEALDQVDDRGGSAMRLRERLRSAGRPATDR